MVDFSGTLLNTVKSPIYNVDDMQHTFFIVYELGSTRFIHACFTTQTKHLRCCVLQAISIVGDEVFSFTMSLTPSATEGCGYTDTSRVDGRVKLNVGCIQVVYLHKFVMSLLVSLWD